MYKVNIYIFMVIAYLIAVLLCGFFLSRREIKNSDDFMVASRRLPLIVLMGTLIATWVGSGTVIGGASFVYQRGPWASIFFFAGAPAGIIVLYFIAGRVRDLAKYTIPQILEMKYGRKARVIATICIILAYIGITSYQYKGGGYILSLTTGMSADVGTALTAVVVILLTMSGGMFSVAYTDAVSAFLILGTLLIALPFTLVKVGGWSFFSQLPEAKLTLTGGLTFAQILGYFFPLGLLILGEQNMYQRFSSASSSDIARKSNIGFFLGDIIIVTLVTILACAAVILFPNINPDTSLLSIFRNTIPPFFGGLGLAAATAFIITTGDSYLLSCSTNVVYDLYVPYINPNASEETKLKLIRLTVLVLGIFSYILIKFFPSVLAIQMYSYTMYGAAITPALLAALLWKKATPAGGVTSIILGGVGTLFWELVLKKPFGWNSVLFAAPLSIIALIVVSLFTANSSNKKIDASI
jgi:SSS family solute:Na+ symporter